MARPRGGVGGGPEADYVPAEHAAATAKARPTDTVAEAAAAAAVIVAGCATGGQGEGEAGEACEAAAAAAVVAATPAATPAKDRGRDGRHSVGHCVDGFIRSAAQASRPTTVSPSTITTTAVAKTATTAAAAEAKGTKNGAGETATTARRVRVAKPSGYSTSSYCVAAGSLRSSNSTEQQQLDHIRWQTRADHQGTACPGSSPQQRKGAPRTTLPHRCDHTAGRATAVNTPKLASPWQSLRNEHKAPGSVSYPDPDRVAKLTTPLPRFDRGKAGASSPTSASRSPLSEAAALSTPRQALSPYRGQTRRGTHQRHTSIDVAPSSRTSPNGSSHASPQSAAATPTRFTRFTRTAPSLAQRLTLASVNSKRNSPLPLSALATYARTDRNRIDDGLSSIAFPQTGEGNRTDRRDQQSPPHRLSPIPVTPRIARISSSGKDTSPAYDTMTSRESAATGRQAGGNTIRGEREWSRLRIGKG